VILCFWVEGLHAPYIASGVPRHVTRPSASNIIPFEPGSGPLNGSAPVYPLGCMKTLAPLPGIQRSMLFAGISANRRVPLCVQTGPSIHLLKPVAMRSAWNQALLTAREAGSSFLNVLRQCGHGESRDSQDQEKEPVYRDRGHGAAKTTGTGSVFMFPLRNFYTASSNWPTVIQICR